MSTQTVKTNSKAMQKKKDITILLIVSGRNKARLTTFYYKMLRGNENYSLTSSEQNSLKKYTSEQIAEKIYNLGESNPAKWNQIMSAIMTILFGGVSILMTLVEMDRKIDANRPSNKKKYNETELEAHTTAKYISYIFLALSLFGNIRLYFYKKSWKRKRRAFLNKLTKSRELLNKLTLKKLI